MFVPQPPGRPMTGGRVRPLTGATHVFGIPHTPRRRLGCARPSHPRLGSLPDQRSHAGRLNGAPRRVPSRPWSVMPHSPPASRSANGCSAASKRRGNGLPARMIRWGATPEGGGDERVKTRTAPRPNGAPVPLGSLPTKPQAAPAPRPAARRSRKTLPRHRICRPGGAHHRSAKMCIDPRCLLHKRCLVWMSLRELNLRVQIHGFPLFDSRRLKISRESSHACREPSAVGADRLADSTEGSSGRSSSRQARRGP